MPVDLQESYDLRLWALIVHYGNCEDDLKSWRLLSKKMKSRKICRASNQELQMFFIPSGFSDFCCFLVASEGGLHRMWCVHHGGSPGFHHVIPGVCTLSSLGSWETFGKPTVSLAPSGLENQMAPWWMLVIPYHTMAENKQLVSMGWYIVAMINDGYNWWFLGDEKHSINWVTS